MTRSGSVVLRLVALVLFILAAIVTLGDASFRADAALVPAGLAAWVGSTLVP